MSNTGHISYGSLELQEANRLREMSDTMSMASQETRVTFFLKETPKGLSGYNY